MAMITETELEAIKVRAAAASEDITSGNVGHYYWPCRYEMDVPALLAEVERLTEIADRRKKHIGLVVQRLRDAGERIRRAEAALPHWANVPTITELVAQRDAALAEVERLKSVIDVQLQGRILDVERNLRLKASQSPWTRILG